MKCSKSHIAIQPGLTIAEQLHYNGVSFIEFARKIDMPFCDICSLITGKIPLTDSVACKLENVLGIPAKFWLKLEKMYKEDLRLIQEEKTAQKNEWQ